jgi:hypothetical protein
LSPKKCTTPVLKTTKFSTASLSVSFKHIYTLFYL